MPFDISEAKSLVRRRVHEAFGVEAMYHDNSMPEAKPVRVRYHNKIVRGDQWIGQGDAEIVEGIQRAIFNMQNLAEQGIVPRAGGRVTMPLLHWNGAVLNLDHMEPRVGPEEEIWAVTDMLRG